MAESSDPLRQRYPAFAVLRDRFGMQTAYSVVRGGNCAFTIKGPAFSISICRDRADEWFDIQPKDRKSGCAIHLVLRELNLWDDRDSPRDADRLVQILDKHFETVSSAMQNEDFWVRRLGRS